MTQVTDYYQTINSFDRQYIALTYVRDVTNFTIAILTNRATSTVTSSNFDTRPKIYLRLAKSLCVCDKKKFIKK